MTDHTALIEALERAVEAVARALWEAQCAHWGHYRESLPDLCAWDNLSESKQRELFREAQAALAAARPLIMEEAAGIVRNELAMVAVLNAEVASPQWMEGLEQAADIAVEAIRTAGSKTDD